MLLIIERNERFKKKLMEHLKVPGLSPHFFDTPELALQDLEGLAPKFFLVDLTSVGSLESLDALHDFAKANDLPFLIIGGQQKTEPIARRLVDKGYDNFIELPFRVSDLKLKIEDMRRNQDPFLGAKIGPKGQEVEITRKLGAGAMGSVYEAHQSELDRRVAVKFLSEAFQSEDGKTGERFLKEARAMAKLRSPNIAQVYYVGNHAGRSYMVMEFIDGPNLNKYLAAKGKLSAQEALTIAREVLLGLDHAHCNGQIHRDIKPANIMLNPGGKSVLLDFGLVRTISDESMTQEGAVLGTPRYISPEQVRGVDVDHRSDLYSVGIILFELMVGLPPFKGKDFYSVLLQHLNDPMPHPETFGVALHPAVWELIFKLTQKKQELRIQSAMEAVKIIERILNTLSPAELQSVPQRAGMANGQGQDWAGMAVDRMGTLRAAFGSLPENRERMLGVLNNLLGSFQALDVLGDFEKGKSQLGQRHAVFFPAQGGLAYISSAEAGAEENFERFSVDDLSRLFEVEVGT